MGGGRGGLKNAIFAVTSFLNAPLGTFPLNETFAPLGNKSFISGKEMKHYAVTWHEALGGRSASEICSAYKLFLCHHRYIANFVFWADNKCCYLYTLLASTVNDKCSTLQSVAIKYFEKGHTFTPADSYHDLVEKAMKNIDDYGDFVAALNKNGVGLIMDSSDFMNIPKGHSNTGGCPKVSDIKVCKFIRGSTKIYWKMDYNESSYKLAEFMQKKLAVNVIKSNASFPRMYPLGPQARWNSPENTSINAYKSPTVLE